MNHHQQDYPARRANRNELTPEATLERQILPLSEAIEAILRESPEGLSELQLIRTLQSPPWALLDSVDFSDPAMLYPVHFLVFHCLYRLRDELSVQGEQLTISPLRITLGPSRTVAGRGMPDAPDALRLFYLDLSQYDLSGLTVRRMVDDFWKGVRRPLTGEGDITEAARALGFDAVPDDFSVIKKAYRKQAMRAHPDRGGCNQDVQVLNQAFACLRQHFRSVVQE
ncbi:DNA-J related domain-containing protein [Marinobacter sp. 1Y8]